MQRYGTVRSEGDSMSETETQIYELHVTKEKAQAVFDAVVAAIQAANAAGKIVSASCTWTSIKRVEI